LRQYDFKTAVGWLFDNFSIAASHIKYHKTGNTTGSRKDLGCFYIKRPHTQKMVLCESAIDALSCFALNPDFIALSTSGANPNPAWLKTFINKGFEIYCGFDADEIGDRLADKMMRRYPSIKRLRPNKHDWNEILQSK
jgi:hypothetical protein